jgi:hypothetical protein
MTTKLLKQMVEWWRKGRRDLLVSAYRNRSEVEQINLMNDLKWYGYGDVRRELEAELMMRASLGRDET